MAPPNKKSLFLENIVSKPNLTERVKSNLSQTRVSKLKHQISLNRLSLCSANLYPPNKKMNLSLKTTEGEVLGSGPSSWKFSFWISNLGFTISTILNS